MPTPNRAPAAPNRIKFWRLQRGWTMQRLAEATGTTRAQIDKLERGTRRLTVDWMVRLAKPLGCDPRSLMNGKELAAATAHYAAQTADTIPLYRLRATTNAGIYRRAAKPARHEPRPWFLASAPTAYGVILPCDAAALPVGDILFVAPEQTLRAGRLALIVTGQGCFLAVLHDATANTLRLQSWPDRKPLNLPREACNGLHAVVGCADVWQARSPNSRRRGIPAR